MDSDGPLDPFRDGQPDWVPLASNNHAFFMAHLAAGFTEAQALELTARYMSFVVSVIYSQPQQPDPGQADESPQ